MRSDSFGLGTFTCLKILIKLLSRQIASLFSRKPLETQRLAEVQILIDSWCPLASQLVEEFELFDHVIRCLMLHAGSSPISELIS